MDYEKIYFLLNIIIELKTTLGLGVSPAACDQSYRP